jgi:hypothetical protein
MQTAAPLEVTKDVDEEPPVMRNASSKILNSFPFSIHRLLELEEETRKQALSRQPSQDLNAGPSLLDTRVQNSRRVQTAHDRQA